MGVLRFRLLRVLPAGLVVALALLAFGAPGARADVFWSSGEGPPYFIGHATLDGSEVNRSFLDTSGADVRGIASDGSYVYGGRDSDIARARINGTEPDGKFISGLNGASVVAVGGNHIYWTNWLHENEGPGEIGRANLNGSEVEPDFITLGPSAPLGLAVSGEHLYWTNNEVVDGKFGAIGRANIDGGEIEEDFITGVEGFEWGLAANESYVYWIGDTTEDKEEVGAIGRASLSGGPVEKTFIAPLKDVSLGGVAVEEEGIYWTDPGADSIGRANLNGTDVDEDFVPDVTDPEGIGLSPRVATVSGAPEVALPERESVTEEFTVSLSFASKNTITVGYATSDGTATTAHADYTPASGTVTFEPGQTTQTVKVQIDPGNGQDEDAKEQYHLELVPATTHGVAISQTEASATGTVGLPGIAGRTEDGKGGALAGVALRIGGITFAGVPVTRTVTTEAGGGYSVHLDPGVYTVTPQGTPPGQSSELSWTPKATCPGTRSGASCQNLTLKPALGTTAFTQVDFIFGALDPQAENLEVLQAVQKEAWDSSGPEIILPDGRKVRTVAYKGVKLGAGSETIARLYAGDNGKLTAEAVTAELRGYYDDDGTLTELPGGPIAPLGGPLNLAASPQEVLERNDPSSSFNFVLPESWTKAGTITLVGTVDPGESFPECSDCRENDSLALTGVTFTAEQPITVLPIALTFVDKGKTIAPLGPAATVSATWPWWPLAREQLNVSAELPAIDITGAIASAVSQVAPFAGLSGDLQSLYTCLANDDCTNVLDDKIFALEREDVGTEPGMPVALFRGQAYAGTQGVTSGGPRKPVFVTDEAAGNRDSIVHEMLHALGFEHTEGCGAKNADPYPVSPPNILGVGLNRSLSGPGGIGPLMFGTGADAYYDLMGYCRPRWISSVNWERLVTRLATGVLPPPVSSLASTSNVHADRQGGATEATAGPEVTVSAALIDRKPVIDNVEQGAIPSSSSASSPYTLVGAGPRRGSAVTAKMYATSDEVEGTTAATSGTVESLTAVIPARALTSLRIELHGRSLARLTLPGRLKLTLLGRHSACLRGGSLSLRYRTNAPAAAFLHARLLAEQGKRLLTVEIGGQRGAITVAKSRLPGKAKRVRLVVNDGLSSAQVTLPLLRARC